MKLASLIERFEAPFMAKYADRLQPAQRRALGAIKRCRTMDAGAMLYRCTDCSHEHHYPRSCGNRSCPQCQNHESSAWLARQQAKLLPLEYFMVTFTLPAQLRPLARAEPKRMYSLLLSVAADTLKSFGLSANWGQGEIGRTGVLHTHSRRLDYHPHTHFIVPGGSMNRARGQLRKTRGKYLFNEFALAEVFRARFLEAMAAEGLTAPAVPAKWVADCQHVGRGLPALKYLSRYLYRGVVSEHNILSEHAGEVCFRYTDSDTGQVAYRTLPGEDFLWLLLQHVLPKGFRRIRDYGFLHGNAKVLLGRIQLMLHVLIQAAAPRPKVKPCCPSCSAPMHLLAVLAPAVPSG